MPMQAYASSTRGRRSSSPSTRIAAIQAHSRPANSSPAARPSPRGASARPRAVERSCAAPARVSNGRSCSRISNNDTATSWAVSGSLIKYAQASARRSPVAVFSNFVERGKQAAEKLPPGGKSAFGKVERLLRNVLPQGASREVVQEALTNDLVVA